MKADLLRLCDFYYLFPWQMRLISPWPREVKKYKSDVFLIEPAYEVIANPGRLIYELRPIFEAAITNLISRGLIDRNEMEGRIVLLRRDRIPSEILDLLEGDDFRKSKVFELISSGLALIDFVSLKERSGIMEYRYG